jgi:O-antigen biosynthesis protein WbqP
MDRLIALFVIILVFPILLVSFIIVWLEDGMPVLFKQERVGQNGIPFVFFKLRSMKRETPQISSNQLEYPEQYLLKSGKWFRKLSIDELPNLFNILRGDMHFIGPRPLLASEVKLNQLRERYGIITSKPGITGWAQVNGRDNISIERKVVLERFYLRHKSLKLKILIVLKSFIIVIRSKGVRF